MPDWSLVLLGFFLGMLLGSLVEYLGHWLMHRRVLLSHTHFNHHREPEGETWVKQFLYYVLGTLPLDLLVVAIAWPVGGLPFGIGMVAGGILWAFWVAYAHTLQHVRPELAFWMPRPIHHLHHVHELDGYNLGLSVDWWDRLFGTYLPMAGTESKPARVRVTLRGLLGIPWFRPWPHDRYTDVGPNRPGIEPETLRTTAGPMDSV